MINTNLNIPLDKFYKIMALGGSAFFILAVYFTYTYVVEFENKRIRNSIASEVVNNEKNLLHEELEANELEFKNIMHKSLLDVIYLNEIAPSLEQDDFNKLAHPITEKHEAKLNENEKKAINLKEKVSKHNSKIIEIKSMDKIISRYDSWKYLCLSAIALISLFSLYVAYLGFKRWDYEEPLSQQKKPKLKK